jgi:hypothetical protein
MSENLPVCKSVWAKSFVPLDSAFSFRAKVGLGSEFDSDDWQHFLEQAGALMGGPGGNPNNEHFE